MKSSISNLKTRGFVDPDSVILPAQTDIDDLIRQLKSSEATERTIAAITIEKILQTETLHPLPSQKKILSEKLVTTLLSALKSEHKLYPKIAISNALVVCGKSSIPSLITALGSIGKNQHTKLPSKPFNKKNYPLPRDIVARILVRLSTPVLEKIAEIIEDLSPQQIREAIDVIGHISFYSGDNKSLPLLKKLYKEKSEDKIIQWKIIRAFSAFKESEVKELLSKIIETHNENAFRWEAERSLQLLTKNQSS